MKFYPYKKGGGAGKVLSMLKGGGIFLQKLEFFSHIVGVCVCVCGGGGSTTSFHP